jgi:hypothetical protein
MTLKGINVVCSCDNNEYSLFTGLSQGGLTISTKTISSRLMGLFSEFIIDYNL